MKYNKKNIRKMNFFSSFSNGIISNFSLICFFGFVCFAGCYSFTGGSIPEHLKTLYITTAKDESGFGNPKYKDELTNALIDNFSKDNSFTLVQSGGDAKLNVSIKSIVDIINAVNPGELETERKITITCKVEYYDAVKKKMIWTKDFSNFDIYELKNVQTARDEAISVAIKRIAEDIMLAVVSGW